MATTLHAILAKLPLSTAASLARKEKRILKGIESASDGFEEQIEKLQEQNAKIIVSLGEAIDNGGIENPLKDYLVNSAKIDELKIAIKNITILNTELTKPAELEEVSK